MVGSGAIEPQMFDPSLDVWFPADDEAVDTYYEIEDRFIAEDYVMVAFEVKDNEYGAFSRQPLSTIARRTERFLTIPGVRPACSFSGTVRMKSKEYMISVTPGMSCRTRGFQLFYDITNELLHFFAKL